VYASAGNSSFSNISYINNQIEANSKDIAVNQTNIYRFYLTNEDDEKIELNGQNIVLEILFYKEQEYWKMMKESIKYLLTQQN
jgi:hypothetical protein